jgi:hypothetical protein
MKIIIYSLLLLFTNSLFAQQQNCNCNQALENLIVKIEKEYPGFADKTEDKFLYEKFKNNILKQAKETTNTDCPGVLKSYTNFFKDPHLWVGANGVAFSNPASKNEQPPAINIDIAMFEKTIKDSKDKLEGIYSNEMYTFGVKKTNSNEYTGFIINSKYEQWKPKDIKFRLFLNGKFVFALLDRTIKTGSYEILDGSIIHLEDVSVVMVKNVPAPALSKAQIDAKLDEMNSFYFKKITPKTALLKLPSFEYQHLQMIDTLIENNKLLLESENLIIDLRGNPGGTTDAYPKLLPYISGKQIKHTRTEFLATQTYINNLEAYKKTLDKNSSTEAIDNSIKKLKENLGNFVSLSETNSPDEQIQTITVVPNSPKRIVILANGLTGSSAEYFLFIAKQSYKVKILGKPSYGALDYGNAYLVDLACSGYQVFLPTYRVSRVSDYPIDNIGIQPDIYMDANVGDWVKYAVEYLEH